MSLLYTPNVVTIANQTASYTGNNTTDIVPFLITSAANFTLPASSGQYAGQILSNRTGGQGIIRVQNSASSTATVTLVAGSGDAISGVTSVYAGQAVICQSNGAGIWTCTPSVAGTGSVVRYQQVCGFAAFTDGGGAAGTLALGVSIPAGVVYERTLFTTLTGFTGNTSATATLGDGSDVDRYNTGTPDFFTTAAAGVDAGVPSGVLFHSAAKTPTLTVTANSDWGLVVAGSVLVTMFWYSPF